MTKTLLKSALLIAVLISSSSWALAELPRCPSGDSDNWNECIGKRTYKNDATYEGEFRNGKENGRGTFLSAYWEKYVGEFKDGKFNGQGSYWYPKASRYDSTNEYVGEWKDGEINGQGTMNYASGAKYIGEWKGGKKDGKGVYYYAGNSEHVDAGMYSKGEFLKAEVSTANAKPTEKTIKLAKKIGAEKAGYCSYLLINILKLYASNPGSADKNFVDGLQAFSDTYAMIDYVYPSDQIVSSVKKASEKINKMTSVQMGQSLQNSCVPPEIVAFTSDRLTNK